MALLLHFVQDQIFTRPEVKRVTVHWSFLTNLPLIRALERLRVYEKAHAELNNGCRLYHRLLGSSAIGRVEPSEMERYEKVMSVHWIETLPRTPDEFEGRLNSLDYQ